MAASRRWNKISTRGPKSVTETIDSRLGTLSSSLTDGAAQAIHAIDSRLTQLASSLTDGTAQAI